MMLCKLSYVRWLFPIISLMRFVFRSFAHLSMFFFLFCFLLWSLEFFEYFTYKSFIRYMVQKYFLPVCCLSFHPLIDFFHRSEFFFLFYKVQIVYFSILNHTFDVHLKTQHQIQSHMDFLLCFF